MSAGAVRDVVVVGGGQAGLAMGHHLARRGFDFTILEAGDGRPRRGSAAGTRCGCSPPPGATRSRAGRSRATRTAIRHATRSSPT